MDLVFFNVEKQRTFIHHRRQSRYFRRRILFYPNTHTWEAKADATKKMLGYDVNHYRTFSTKEKSARVCSLQQAVFEH
jgi:hypothetical protein